MRVIVVVVVCRNFVCSWLEDVEDATQCEEIMRGNRATINNGSYGRACYARVRGRKLEREAR